MPAEPAPNSVAHAAEPPVTPERPWLGLAAFTDACRDYFYGRDAEVGELTDRIRRAPLTLLYGVSGYGKSSLLGAGVVPALRERGYTVVFLRRCYDDLAERPLTGDLLTEVAGAIPGSLLPGAETPAGLWEFFHDRAQPWLAGPVEETENDREDEGERRAGIVILLDQFEEIFTKGEDRASGDAAADTRAHDNARDFLTQLAGLVENRPSDELTRRIENASLEEKRTLLRRYDFQARPVRVALALREDFLARIERLRRIMPSLMRQRVELRLLSGEQAFRSVFEPGAKRPGQPPIIPREVAEAVVCAAAGAAPGTELRDIEAVPPILSLLCERLNARRLASQPAAACVTDEDFAPGEASRILGTFYHEKTAHHPRALRDYLEDRLASESGLRETVTLDSALVSLRVQGVPDALTRLRALVDDRIVVIEERGSVQRLEFTHDTLAAHAHLRRTERATRRRRRRAVVTVIACLFVAAGSLGLVFWANTQKHRLAEQKQRLAEQKLKAENISKSYQETFRKLNDVSTWGSNIPDAVAEQINAAVCECFERNPPAPDDLYSLVTQSCALSRRGDLLGYGGRVNLNPLRPEDLNPTAERAQRLADSKRAYQEALKINRDVLVRGVGNQLYQAWRGNLASTLERIGNTAYNECRLKQESEPVAALALIDSAIKDHLEAVGIYRSLLAEISPDIDTGKFRREALLNHLGSIVYALELRADLQKGNSKARVSTLREWEKIAREAEGVYDSLIADADKPDHQSWKASVDRWKDWKRILAEKRDRMPAEIEAIEKAPQTPIGR